MVVTPLCFFMSARFRGTAQVPRRVLQPDVIGSAKSGAERTIPVTVGVRDDVWIVRLVAPAQSADGELGAPHVRLRLLQRQRSITLIVAW